MQPALRFFLQLQHAMSLSGVYLVLLSQKFTALTCLASCIVAASLKQVTLFRWLIYAPVLGADSNICTCLATCLANYFATSAWDKLLRHIFNGALSKIHCSNLLGKLHCSCIFKTGYSISLVNLRACFGADSNILHVLQPALRIFLQLPHGMCLSGIYLVVFS